MMKSLVAAAIALAALVPGAANAAVFTLSAAGTDAQNGASLTYEGELTTGDATSGTDGDVYQILGASGTASSDGMDGAINGAFGSFTLRGGAIVSIEAYFQLDKFMGGTIQKNASDQFLGISESAGPITSLSLTPQVSAVPEPASWALMTIGFGALGLALRGARALRLTLA